jgi:FAD:protein FMN transferase
MATTFELLLPFGQRNASALARDVLELIDELESQLTVYREDSEVSEINRRADREAVRVEQGLFELLLLAQRLTAETGGAFDVTAGPLIKAWGFFRREGRVPSPAERQEALEHVGMKYVELNSESRAVRFLKPGMEINLGSIGKGYALDRCAALLRQRGAESGLLHGGGSSVLAVGSQPGDPRGWPVGIRHPWDDSRRIAVIHLRDRALATSAATYQNFEYNNRRLGHLLDPRSGRPAEGVASASAVALSAAEADALATAFYVLGIDKTRLFCQRHPEFGAIVLPEGNDAQLVVFNLAPEVVSQLPLTR